MEFQACVANLVAEYGDLPLNTLEAEVKGIQTQGQKEIHRLNLKATYNTSQDYVSQSQK